MLPQSLALSFREKLYIFSCCGAAQTFRRDRIDCLDFLLFEGVIFCLDWVPLLRFSFFPLVSICLFFVYDAEQMFIFQILGASHLSIELSLF